MKMQLAIKWPIACALLALPSFAIAQVGLTANGNGVTTSRAISPAAPDSPAQLAMRQIASMNQAPRPLRLPATEIAHPDLVTRLEEIRVYGRNEPEDYVGPKLSPMMQFRARLERDVPLSPAKKAQRLLCIIGLCSNDGPEGIPLGDSPEHRAEARLERSTLQLNKVTGTLQ